MSHGVIVSFKIDPQLITLIDQESIKRRQSRSEFLRRAVVNHLAALGVPVSEDLIYPPDPRTTKPKP